jgi:hypothetical protein
MLVIEEESGLKKLFIVSVSVLAIFFFLLAKEDDSLKVRASIDPKRLSRGQEGKVTLRLRIKDGIAINPQPSFIIEFDSSDEVVFPKNFFTASDLEIETVEENGEEYLNLEQPIEIPFTINLKAKRGNHVLNGKVKYFACCKVEGWCLKSRTTFSASFYTRSSVVKKKK